MAARCGGEGGGGGGRKKEEGRRKEGEGRREKTDIKSNNPHLTGVGFPGGGAGGGGDDPTDFQHDMKLHY